MSDEPITVEFKDARHIDISIQLKPGDTIGNAIAHGEHRVANFFCELAALYQEDERLRAVMDRFDIVVSSANYTIPNPDGKWTPDTILFETAKAKLARAAQRAF